MYLLQSDTYFSTSISTENQTVGNLCHLLSICEESLFCLHNKGVSGRLKDASGKAQNLLRAAAFCLTYS